MIVRAASMLGRVHKLKDRVSISIIGLLMDYRIDIDVKDPIEGRVFIQVTYIAPCSKTRYLKKWKGRKWYLSQHMSDDEIIKTFYLAFEIAVRHEILEGFKIDGKSIFNPHLNFEELLTICESEIKREEI